MAEAVQGQQITENELEQPRWAVISFERCEGAGLTYKQAAQLLEDLDSRKVSGLAIVADEVASRIES